MSTFDDRTLVEDMVANGVDDWVYEALVSGNIARRVVSAPTERRAVALGLIAEVLFSGLMEAGETQKGRGFVPWGTDPGESLSRVADHWMGREDPDVGPGEIVWLRNTAAGDAIGAAVLSRENS
ncbi:MAG: hypothetical protein GY701_23615 [Sulfitobacter sp.]|nr:hypothetical protein [Sulfitobacter sp.]MCP4100342.1 hypothetical protein [Lentisphaerota bacterium]